MTKRLIERLTGKKTLLKREINSLEELYSIVNVIAERAEQTGEDINSRLFRAISFPTSFFEEENKTPKEILDFMYQEGLTDRNSYYVKHLCDVGTEKHLGTYRVVSDKRKRIEGHEIGISFNGEKGVVSYSFNFLIPFV
jgi:hypothetical protein